MIRAVALSAAVLVLAFFVHTSPSFSAEKQRQLRAKAPTSSGAVAIPAFMKNARKAKT
jgi:hypothetical protein